MTKLSGTRYISAIVASPLPTLRLLTSVFVRYANLTLGGGSATTAVLHRELVDKRQWITENNFVLCFALARLTPGTNLLAFCTGIGWLLQRFAGAVAVLLAASIPCSLFVLVVTIFFTRWHENIAFKIAMQGATAAAVGITIITCWTLTKPYVRHATWSRIIPIVGLAFVLAAFYSIPPVRILLGGAVLGALLPLWEKKT